MPELERVSKVCILSLAISGFIYMFTKTVLPSDTSFDKNVQILRHESILLPPLSSSEKFITELIQTHLKKTTKDYDNLVSSKDPRCRPKCGNRTKNAVILVNQELSGLMDRYSIIKSVGNLAAYFCAELIIQKPCKMLDSQKHGNYGKIIECKRDHHICRFEKQSCDIHWTDFRVLKSWDRLLDILKSESVADFTENSYETYAYDYQYDTDDNPPEELLDLDKIKEDFEKIYEQKYGAKSKYKKRLINGSMKSKLFEFHLARIQKERGIKIESQFVPKRVLDRKPKFKRKQKPVLNFQQTFEKQFDLTFSGMSVDKYEVVSQAFLQEKSFLWKIDTWFYDWRKDMNEYFQSIEKFNQTFPLFSRNRPSKKELACEFPLEYSEKVIALTKDLLIFNNFTRDFTTLHIRRRDAIKQCDTSIEKLESYLDCSLQNCKDLDAPVIIFTDELERESYVKSIQEILKNLGRKGIDGEQMIEDYFDQAVFNNKIEEIYYDSFFMFEISNFIKDLAKHKLVQRRTFQCHSCDDVCS